MLQSEVRSQPVAWYSDTDTALPFLASTTACTSYTGVTQKFPGKERWSKSPAAHEHPKLVLRSPYLLAKSLLFRSHCSWIVNAEGSVVILKLGETGGSWPAYTLSKIVHIRPLIWLCVCPAAKWEWWALSLLETPLPTIIVIRSSGQLPQLVTMVLTSPPQWSECQQQGECVPYHLGSVAGVKARPGLWIHLKWGLGMGCRCSVRILFFIWHHC